MNPQKGQIHESLLAEQGHVCIYCGKRITTNYRSSHIEHFRPKSKHGALRFDWDNLFASCGPTGKANTPKTCGDAILAIEANGRDPILYFYEDFLEVFDPAARERYGVFYTPLEVVRYMVGALDRVLRDHLGTQGLCDPNVTILDPATGTGTFLLGVAERVRDLVVRSHCRMISQRAMSRCVPMVRA